MTTSEIQPVRDEDYLTGLCTLPGDPPKYTHTQYLCDHAGDIAGVGGQQQGVGLLGEVGERRHVLLGHAQRRGRAPVLTAKQTNTTAVNTSPYSESYAVMRGALCIPDGEVVSQQRVQQ